MSGTHENATATEYSVFHGSVSQTCTHITLRGDFLRDRKSHLKGTFPLPFMRNMKNVPSPALRPSGPRLTHIKQSEGTVAPAYVLTVGTHIICHSTLSVIMARWGHQLPPVGAAPPYNVQDASFLSRPPATAIPQCEEMICHAGKVAHRLPLKHALGIVSLCTELHLIGATCDSFHWIDRVTARSVPVTSAHSSKMYGPNCLSRVANYFIMEGALEGFYEHNGSHMLL